MEKIVSENPRKCSNCIKFKVCGDFKAASVVLKDSPYINVEESLAYTCQEFIDAKLFKNLKMGEQLYTR